MQVLPLSDALEVAVQVAALELVVPQLEELLPTALLAARSEASPVVVFAAALGPEYPPHLE
jgi:hypothetical protein